MNRESSKDLVGTFWEAVSNHDWEMLAETLADDFIRIGMTDDAKDTSKGKKQYLDFVEGVIGKMHHHELETIRMFCSHDGRLVLHEAIERIQPSPDDDPIEMRFANVHEINDEGLISKLDIFWKTPPTLPPDWITVEKVISDRRDS